MRTAVQRGEEFQPGGLSRASSLNFGRELSPGLPTIADKLLCCSSEAKGQFLTHYDEAAGCYSLSQSVHCMTRANSGS